MNTPASCPQTERTADTIRINHALVAHAITQDKVARADYTIDTDTTLEETDAQVQALLYRLLPDGYEGHPKTADA